MRSRIRIQHKSARGAIVDMEALRNQNAAKPAIGNASMNAHGDIINRSGKIVVRREQIMQQYYANNPQGVKNASLKHQSPDTFETPQQAVERLSKQINKNQQPQPDEPQNILDKSKRTLVDKAI